MQDLRVLHLVDADGCKRVEALMRTLQTMSSLGLGQELIFLNAQPFQARFDLPGVEARVLRRSANTLEAQAGVVGTEFARLTQSKPFYAIHLHGARACLHGSRALRAGGVAGRQVYSPHLGQVTPAWKSALIGRLLKSELSTLRDYVVTASPLEAHAVSRLLERSAEVLPQPVDDAFFASPRREGARPGVLAGGHGTQAVEEVSRLGVLLNARDERVPISWLEPAERPARELLRAAGIRVLACGAPEERAARLATATAYLHFSSADPLSPAVAEAMAAGVPCLVSDTPAHRWLVRHGETGLVCSSRGDFVEHLVLLLRDRSERERIGGNARIDAQNTFTVGHFEKALLRAYRFQRTPAVRLSHPPALSLRS